MGNYAETRVVVKAKVFMAPSNSHTGRLSETHTGGGGAQFQTVSPRRHSGLDIRAHPPCG